MDDLENRFASTMIGNDKQYVQPSCFTILVQLGTFGLVILQLRLHSGQVETKCYVRDRYFGSVEIPTTFFHAAVWPTSCETSTF